MIKKVKAWAIFKGKTFSHVQFEKENAETWEGYKIIPCTISYSLPLRNKPLKQTK